MAVLRVCRSRSRAAPLLGHGRRGSHDYGWFTNQTARSVVFTGAAPGWKLQT